MKIRGGFLKAIFAFAISCGAAVAVAQQPVTTSPVGIFEEPASTTGASRGQPASGAETYVSSPDFSTFGSCEGGNADAATCDACDSCRGALLGIIQPTSTDFCNFISPMTNPVYFEDPRNVSELRFIFLNHITPPALGADSVRLLAMQFRAKLTERLSVIATKDGFIMSDSPLLNDGWADVNAGLKYLLYSDVESQTLLSAGLTYTLPTGSPRALQARGNGEFHAFLTGGTQLGDNYHFISGSGFILPSNAAIQNKMFYWSNHIDRMFLFDGLYAFGECNYYNYLSSANGFPAAVEGGDLFNLGSTGVAGHDLVTGAFGFKYKWNCWNELGVAWEVPLTARRGVLDNRLTADYIIRW